MLTLLGYFSNIAAANNAALANGLVKSEDTTKIVDGLLALIESDNETRWAYTNGGVFELFTTTNAANLIGLNTEVVNIITSTQIDAARLKTSTGSALTYEQIFSKIAIEIENAKIKPQTHAPFHLMIDLEEWVTDSNSWSSFLAEFNFPGESWRIIHVGSPFGWSNMDPNIIDSYNANRTTLYGQIFTINDDGIIEASSIITPSPHDYITHLSWDINDDGTIQLNEGGTNYQYTYTGTNTSNNNNGWTWEEIHQLNPILLQTLSDFHTNGGPNAYALKSEIHQYLIARTDYNPKTGAMNPMHPAFGIPLESTYPNMSCFQVLSGELAGAVMTWINPSAGGPGSGAHWKMLSIAN